MQKAKAIGVVDQPEDFSKFNIEELLLAEVTFLIQII
jgi:hypothetical protein